MAYQTLSKRSGESAASSFRQLTLGLIALVLLAAACIFLLPETPAVCEPDSSQTDAFRDYLRLKVGDIRAEVSWQGRCPSAP